MSNNPNLQSLPVFKTKAEQHEIFSIYQFECSNCGLEYLEEKTFDAMPALARLDLSKNRLEQLPKNLFSKLQSLNDLNLADNWISKLNPNMFYGAVSLTKLNLAGNLLKKLQVTPFLVSSNLFKLDVSGNQLERVWSEAREPLMNLRYLSVSKNALKRFTVEELKATPKLSELNMNGNPLLCDRDFKDTLEYLTRNGIIPKQSFATIEDFKFHKFITQWSDLAKNVCQFLTEGPPSRTPDNFPVNVKPTFDKTSTISPSGNSQKDVTPDDLDDEDENEEDEDEDMNQAYDQDIGDGIVFSTPNYDDEYDKELRAFNYEYRAWYNGILWPVMITIFVTLVVFWLVAVFVYLSKRRRNGPVLRPPMILRQGFIDNKNCGLVYKPLQEEIPTTHAPKRGSFYSSSTFHYNKIVPESV